MFLLTRLTYLLLLLPNTHLWATLNTHSTLLWISPTLNTHGPAATNTHYRPHVDSFTTENGPQQLFPPVLKLQRAAVWNMKLNMWWVLKSQSEPTDHTQEVRQDWETDQRVGLKLNMRLNLKKHKCCVFFLLHYIYLITLITSYFTDYMLHQRQSRTFLFSFYFILAIR